MPEYPAPLDYHDLTRPEAPSRPAFDKGVHLTVKFNMPLRHLHTRTAAVAEARRLAGEEAERAVEWVLAYGVTD